MVDVLKAIFNWGCRASDVSRPLALFIVVLKKMYHSSPFLCQALSTVDSCAVDSAAGLGSPVSTDCHRNTGQAGQSLQHNSEVPKETLGYQTESFKPMGPKPESLTAPPLGTAATALVPEGVAVSVDRSCCVSCWDLLVQFLFSRLLVGPSPRRCCIRMVFIRPPARTGNV